MIVELKLDKRIKDFSDVQTRLRYDDELIGEKGYFTDDFADLEDLNNCQYDKLSKIDARYDMIFLTQNDVDNNYCGCRFFVPEKLLKPVEKKYRAFSLKEWCREQSIGDKIIYRYKGTYCGDHREAEVMYLGYIKPLDRVIDEAGQGELMLGINCHGLQNLFENYEIWKDGEWMPFGIEIEEQI